MVLRHPDGSLASECLESIGIGAAEGPAGGLDVEPDSLEEPAGDAGPQGSIQRLDRVALSTCHGCGPRGSVFERGNVPG